jgi:hypothetical protein
MESADASRWLVFDVAEWPGACPDKRFEAWQTAGREAYREDPTINALMVLRAQRDARLSLSSTHTVCEFCRKVRS